MIIEGKVLARIVTLWNHDARHASRSSRAYSRNSSIKPEEIHRRLLKEFSSDEICAEVTNYLQSASAIAERDETPSPCDVFLSGCCLLLVADRMGVTIPVSLAQRLVCTFPVSIWYRSICLVIARYLDRTQLLEALADGMRGASSPYLVENCLSGIVLYGHLPRKDEDPERLRRASDEIGAKIDSLALNFSSDMRRLADRARASLSAYA